MKTSKILRAKHAKLEKGDNHNSELCELVSLR